MISCQGKAKLVTFPRAATLVFWNPTRESNNEEYFTSNEKQIIDVMHGVQQIISINVIPSSYMLFGG
jgi:hypothetical protein